MFHCFLFLFSGDFLNRDLNHLTNTFYPESEAKVFRITQNMAKITATIINKPMKIICIIKSIFFIVYIL